MSALTTRLNLYKFGGGSDGAYPPDEVMDVKRLNTLMDYLDTSIYPTVANLTALVALLPNVPEGAVVSVGNYVFTGSIRHAQSVWQKSGGYWIQAPGTAISTQGEATLADIVAFAAAFDAFKTANASALGVYWGHRIRSGNLGYPVEMVFTTDGWAVVPGPYTMAHFAYNGASDPNFPNQSWGTVPFDTVFTDPMGMNNGGNTWKAPLTGRYQVRQRIRPLFEDTTNRCILRWFNITGNYDIAWETAGHLKGQDPRSITTEWNATAGDVIRCDFWQGTGITQYLSHYDNFANNRMEQIVRYMGRK